MRKIILILLLLLILDNGSKAQQSILSPAPESPAIIPLPVRAQSTGGLPFIIKTSTVIICQDSSLSGTAKLLDLYQSFYTNRHLRLKQVPPDSNYILLRIDTVLTENKEGYLLRIEKDHIDLAGHDAAGILYGIQTLRQLWQPLLQAQGQQGLKLQAQGQQGLKLQAQGQKGQPLQVLSVPAYTVLDYPRFGYRGMHLDVGRHFFPVPFIKKFIDLLALYKFNTFHWHLTEDQGWRIEIKRYPRLQSVAAWRSETLIGHKRETPHRFDGKKYGGYYSQQNIREIVKYAASRHITIIPEIEMPGHAQAALAAYPWLGCTGGPYHTATYWGVWDDVFCAGKDSVFVFLEHVLDEVMELFPSAYIHIGGDECPKTRWKACPHCQRRMRELGLKDEHALQSYFIQRLEKYINSKGRHIIGWDEILEGGLAPDATVMSWRGEEGGLAAARQKHSVIMAPETHLYFDYYQSLYRGEPTAAGGYTPLSKVYAYEPLAATHDREIKKYITGIQGEVWTEYLSTPAKVEYMLLPRAAAVAELAWSPAPATFADLPGRPASQPLPGSASRTEPVSELPHAGATRDYDDFLRRIRVHKRLLNELKVHYADNFDEITYSSSPAGKKIQVTLFSGLPAAQIRYTMDNSRPGLHSPVYTGPLLLDSDCTVEAVLFDKSRSADLPQGQSGERVFEESFHVHKAIGATVSLEHQPVERFNPGAQALVNGITGSRLYNDGQWLGFSGDDLEAVIDLGVVSRIHSVGMNLLNYHWQKMWAPVSLQFLISVDGVHFKEIYEQRQFPVNGINTVRHVFADEEARWVKVKAINPGVIPAGEYGAGGKPLLMADEIIIE